MLTEPFDRRFFGRAPARGYGASKADFLDFVTSAIFASPVCEGYGGAIAEDRFEPAGFELTTKKAFRLRRPRSRRSKAWR